MNWFHQTLNGYYRHSNRLLFIAPALAVLLRLMLADAFFKSGLTKIQTWESTLYLFREEYHVPLLAPEFAAWLATAAELGLSVLLVAGLFGRVAALGLFVLNAVAAYSYYDQLGEAGLNQHLYWGLLLAVLLVHGMGKWSGDAWLEKRAH